MVLEWCIMVMVMEGVGEGDGSTVVDDCGGTGE